MIFLARNKFFKIFFTAFLPLFIFISAGFSVPQPGPAPLWGQSGIIINDTFGDTIQEKPKIAKVSLSEYVVVWEDERNGTPKLYALKMNDQGNILWDKNGIPLTASTSRQTFHSVISGNNGAVYIVWQDDRSGQPAIFVQKLDPSGNKLFGEEGLKVCLSEGSQLFPEAVPDADQGIVVVWHDYRASDEDIYAQKISPNGKLVWGEAGKTICGEYGTQWYPKIAFDNLGGVVIVWADRRSGNFNIYAQHLNKEGETLWQKNGIAVCGSDFDQEQPQVSCDKQGNSWFAWEDKRENNKGIFTQKFDISGNPKYAGGIKASSNFDEFSNPRALCDEDGSLILSWADSHAGDNDIYSQKISSQGILLWGEEGLPIAVQAGSQDNPKVFLSKEGYLYLWETADSRLKKINMQFVDKPGKKLFQENGICVSPKNKKAENADAVLFGGNQAIVAYQAGGGASNDIKVRKISLDAALTPESFEENICDVKGKVEKRNLGVASDHSGNLFFVFEDARNGFYNSYIQKANNNGQLMWGKEAVPVLSESRDQLNSVVVPDELGGAFVFWQESKDLSLKIYAAHFTALGVPDALTKITPSAESSEQKSICAVPDGKNGAIVAFADIRDAYNGFDLYAQRINSQGALLYGGKGLPICLADLDQDNPVIDKNNFVIVWEDKRDGEKNSDIFAQRLDLDGNLLWREDGLPVCNAPDMQISPRVVSDNKNIFVSWSDKSSGSYDIYAQLLNLKGETLWIKDGIPVCQSARAQQNQQSCPLEAGKSFFAWEDFRYGNWDIFAQGVNFEGKLLYNGQDESSVPICLSQGTQYALALLALDSTPIIAWEDFRNGLSYDIYLQRLDKNGIKQWSNFGFLANGNGSGSRSPKLVKNGKNHFVLAWEEGFPKSTALLAQRFKL